MASAQVEVEGGGNGYAEALVHESPDGLIALAPDGTIRFWNQGAQALFGYSAAESIGQSFEALVIPSDRLDEARSAMAEVLDRGVALFETERQRKDGSRVAVDVSLRLVRDRSGAIRFIAANYKDISQLRALREECATEARFRGLLEAAPDAMVIIGPDGRISLVNSETERLFGYQREELLGQPIELLVPEHSRRTHPGRRANQGTQVRLRSIDAGADLLGRRKDGSEFPCEIRLAPMETEGGRLVTAAIRDISARKKVEAKFRSLLEAAPDAMVIMNQFGHVVLVNSATETLFGYDRRDLVGQSVAMLLPERTRLSPDRLARFFTDPTARSMGAGLEITGLRKDGSEFPAEASISPLDTEEGPLILSAVRDVTERKKAEEKFRALMEAAPDAMVIVAQDGHILLVNAQTEKLFGYRREELIGKPADILVPERFRASGGHAGHLSNSHALSAGQELWGLRRDQVEFPIEINASPLRTDEGRLIVNAIRDVTERKHLEERMQQANRLKSEFLANMSHELRTPLNAIIGFTELMHYQEVEPGSNEQKEFLVHILTSSRHLLQLVNDILDLSKIEAGKMEFRPEPIDLAHDVQEVVGMLSSIAAGKRIDLSMEVADLGEIHLDPARLKQVLNNYLSNALKFTPEGGRVVVRVKPERAERFRLEVEDSGVGIRASDLRRLFVEFHQLESATTKRHAGTGLGLALTKRIVEAQGGSVGVRSEPGKGSVFHAVMPRHSRLTVHIPQPPSLKNLPGAGPSILVIDDDDADRDLLVRTLGGAGYAVDTAITASEGLDMLRAGSFDAITIHLSLPDVSGLKVLQEIRRSARTAHLPVVIVTVVNETGAVSGFAAQDVLPKPAQQEALLAALERAGIHRGIPGSVLVVDDDADNVILIKRALQELGLRAICRSDAKGALHAAQAMVPNAIMVDLTMPQMDGFEFLERFRDMPENRDVPVFILTPHDLAATGEHAHSSGIKVRDAAHVLLSRAGGNMAELLQEMKRVLPRRGPAEKESVDHVG